MGTTRTREKGCIFFSCMRLLTIKLRKEKEQIQIESNKRRERERHHQLLSELNSRLTVEVTSIWSGFSVILFKLAALFVDWLCCICCWGWTVELLLESCRLRLFEFCCKFCNIGRVLAKLFDKLFVGKGKLFELMFDFISFKWEARLFCVCCCWRLCCRFKILLIALTPVVCEGIRLLGNMFSCFWSPEMVK